MKVFRFRTSLLAAAILAAGSVVAHAQSLFITEVHPSGSGNANGYAADWFELTNTGSSALNIAGWKVDDDSNSFATAIALNGITSIGAGQSAIFIEGTSATANLFISSWFNGTAPAGFLIGSYTGSGIGLSTSGDQVNIFNAGGTKVAGVTFGAATATRTFDNTALLNYNGTTNATIATLSSVGVNGAFQSPQSLHEVGSPGVAIPEPSTYALLLGLGVMGFVAIRRQLVPAV